MRYRFTLEKYKGRRTRHTCPKCGKSQVLIRYVDTETGRHLADHVGRCNREVNCGYHYPPKQYFSDSQISSCNGDFQRRPKQARLQKLAPNPISTIPFEMFSESLAHFRENNFVRYLQGLFGTTVTSKLIKRFYIGASDYWRGATVFWQIDVRGHIRSGKIMLYDIATGRRVKDVQPDGSKRSKITWAHSILQKQGRIQDFNLRQCLFGEHQLAGQHKPVAVVESEKTAIVASAHLTGFVWLACGSSTNLTADKFRVLAGRKVVLFPDLKCFEKWRERSRQLQAQLDCSITVSDLLEREASEADKEQGLDLADYLTRLDETLPDEIYIPANVPNSIGAISRCIEAQPRG